MPVFEYLDLSGDVAFGPFEYAMPFGGGAAVVKIDGLFGAIDHAGDLIVEPRFATLHGFDDGLAAARLPGGKMGYIGRDGQWTIEPKYDFTLPFSHGFGAVVRGGEIPSWAAAFQIGPNGGEWAAVNAAGERVTEDWWDFVAPGDGPMLLNKGGNANGFVLPANGNNRYLDLATGKTRGWFQSATPFGEGLAIVRPFDGAFQIVDRDLTVTAELELNAMGSRLGQPGVFAEGRAILEIGVGATSAKYAIINTSGATIIDDLGYASPFADGVAAINRGGTQSQGGVNRGQWGFIDQDAAEFTTRPEWTDARAFSQGLGLVGIGKSMRFVDRQGETLFDVADFARPPSEGFIVHRRPG